MNRIRQKGGMYQVLLTPYKVGDDGFAELIGHWTDENMRNFSIIEYKNINDAMYEACNYPDMNWERLHIFHKDIYADLYKRIKIDLDLSKFIYDFEPHLLSGEQIKKALFDRVENFGDRFTLSNNMNDVISFHIINPWTKNLNEITMVLKQNQRLKIKKRNDTNGVIRLVGNTDLSTTYEIVLWPTIISQWVKWVSKNPTLPEKQIALALKDALKNQELLDSNVGIR